MAKGKSRTAAKTRNAAKLDKPGTALAPVAPSALPQGLKPIRNVTLPSLVLKKAGEGRALLFLDEMRMSKVEGKLKADGTREDPATVCSVGDVQTGEQFIFLVPAVVRKNLDQEYAEGGYVRRVFWIENRGKRTTGQRYNDFSITECDASDLTAAAASAA